MKHSDETNISCGNEIVVGVFGSSIVKFYCHNFIATKEKLIQAASINWIQKHLSIYRVKVVSHLSGFFSPKKLFNLIWKTKLQNTIMSFYETVIYRKVGKLWDGISVMNISAASFNFSIKTHINLSNVEELLELNQEMNIWWPFRCNKVSLLLLLKLHRHTQGITQKQISRSNIKRSLVFENYYPIGYSHSYKNIITFCFFNLFNWKLLLKSFLYALKRRRLLKILKTE